MICYRVRTFQHWRFVEVFVEYHNGVFVLPKDLPTRFQGRATPRGESFFEIASEAKVSLRKKETFGDGVWIVESETIPQGGLPELDVPYLCTYFDTPVHANIPWTFLANLANVNAYDAPVALYHGTARESVKTILKEGLKPTFGMFGPCVYLGTVWKAYRFASMTQDYIGRAGALFRVLSFWKKPVIRSALKDPRCHCDTCNGKVTYSDHLATWKSSGDCVYFFPVKLNGTFVVKNMEVAGIDTSKLLLDTVCCVAPKEGFYEPTERTVFVL
jgi:hypothetical protein